MTHEPGDTFKGPMPQDEDAFYYDAHRPYGERLVRSGRYATEQPTLGAIVTRYERQMQQVRLVAELAKLLVHNGAFFEFGDVVAHARRIYEACGLEWIGAREDSVGPDEMELMRLRQSVVELVQLVYKLDPGWDGKTGTQYDDA